MIHFCNYEQLYSNKVDQQDYTSIVDDIGSIAHEYFKADIFLTNKIRPLLPTDCCDSNCWLVYVHNGKKMTGFGCIIPVNQMIEASKSKRTVYNKHLDQFKDCLYVYNIIVDPDHRKQGIARQIVTAIVEKFGNDHALLTDTSHDFMAKMFESLDFQRRDDHFMVNGDTNVTYLKGSN